MKITVIGKKGCDKCAKMDMILRGRGHDTNVIYADGFKTIAVGTNLIEVEEGMHFPIYVTEKGVFYDFKNLTDSFKIN